MNRVLSWPQTPVLKGLLEALRRERQRTEVTPRGTVRFEHALGTIEMAFSLPEQQPEPGTSVYVWWKGGGFVCAPIDEYRAEQRETQAIVDRVNEMRLHLAEARRHRHDELLSHFDIELPLEVDEPPRDVDAPPMARAA